MIFGQRTADSRQQTETLIRPFALSLSKRRVRVSFLLLSAVCCLVSGVARAATFIVAPDSTMVVVSKAIVVAISGESHARWACSTGTPACAAQTGVSVPHGWIETVTTMHAEEVIK